VCIWMGKPAASHVYTSALLQLTTHRGRIHSGSKVNGHAPGLLPAAGGFVPRTKACALPAAILPGYGCCRSSFTFTESFLLDITELEKVWRRDSRLRLTGVLVSQARTLTAGKRLEIGISREGRSGSGRAGCHCLRRPPNILLDQTKYDTI